MRPLDFAPGPGAPGARPVRGRRRRPPSWSGSRAASRTTAAGPRSSTPTLPRPRSSGGATSPCTRSRCSGRADSTCRGVLSWWALNPGTPDHRAVGVTTHLPQITVAHHTTFVRDDDREANIGSVVAQESDPTDRHTSRPGEALEYLRVSPGECIGVFQVGAPRVVLCDAVEDRANCFDDRVDGSFGGDISRDTRPQSQHARLGVPGARRFQRFVRGRHTRVADRAGDADDVVLRVPEVAATEAAHGADPWPRATGLRLLGAGVAGEELDGLLAHAATGRRPTSRGPARRRPRPRGSARGGCARCRCSCGRAATLRGG